MPRVTIYLNFVRETEAAFNFYKRVFGTEFEGEPQRFGNIPDHVDMPTLPEEDKKLIMHIALPIFDGYMLYGSDAPESMGYELNFGNNSYIMLEVDSKEQADKLFNQLKEGGMVVNELSDQFWGDYYGDLIDQFGVKWMVACPI